MTQVGEILRGRWLSGRHVGDSKPALRAFIRSGHFDRVYAPWAVDGRTLFDCWILGHRGNPWQAFWSPSTPYAEIPNILSADFDQGFDNNGVQTMTMNIENVLHEALDGVAGIFHKVRRGYFSPLRGYTLPTFPGMKDPLTGEDVQTNDWFQLLNSNAQITVWAGYGGDSEALVPIFTGLIDTTDCNSKPDRITVTARDFGQALTDQPVFGWVKDRRLKDPIVFADRRKSDDVLKEGSSARASSSSPGHLPRFVLDKGDTGNRTYWASAPRATPNDTEWIEIRLPQGTYEDFLIYPYYTGQEMYVSFYAAPTRPTKHNPDPRPFVNGARVDPGWVDIGKGTVPDEDGGKPYVLKVNNVSARSRTYGLGCRVFTGDGAKLRIHFRKLRHSTVEGRTGYRAGVRRLVGLRRRLSKTAKVEQWILVSDLADVVKCTLRWAGFHEWEIEDTGISLSDPLVVNRQNKLMDIISKMSDLTGYVFAIQPPVYSDPGDSNIDSIGVPIWRRSIIFAGGRQPVIEQVKDSDLLTGVKAHFTDEPLAHVIVARGKEATKKQGGTLEGGGGHGTTADRRIQARYYPPWGGVFGAGVGGHVNFGSERLGGLAKPVLHVDPQLRTEFECKIACMLIAIQEALASATGVIEFPYYPGVELDELIGVQDTASGMNSRLWIAQKSASYDNGQFTMTLQGSWTDTPDMLGIVGDWFNAIRDLAAQDEARDSRVVSQRKAPRLATSTG